MNKTEIREKTLDGLINELQDFIELSLHDKEISLNEWIRKTFNKLENRCWEVKHCDETNCPAYKNECGRCWLIAGTMCGSKPQGRFVEKYNSCLECEIFLAVMGDDKIHKLREFVLILIYSLQNKILEKSKLEAQLHQSHKMEAIGTMAGGIAHDFNNILTIIAGNATLALEDMPADSPARGNIEKISKASIRATELVSQILAFSRKEKKELIPIRPQVLIKETLKFLRSTTPTTVSILQDICSDCGKVLADPTGLHQVTMNLFTNAVHAIDEKGEVSVSLHEVDLTSDDLEKFPYITPLSVKTPGKYAKLSVADKGTGMDEKILNRVFDPFFTTKEVGKGTGMGLSVVHGIVESHSGFMTVESEPGQGSTFNVFIPISEVEEEELLETETGEAPTSGTERVLVIDDEVALLELAGRILINLGYTVTVESSSTKALELFKANPDQFDLIITDLSMPNMSGTELVAEVLKIRPDMPCILCSGFSSKISELNAREKGISKYLKKPYNKKILSEAVREVLNVKV